MKLSEIHLILCDVRKEREMAQRDIAQALNIEQATVSMYETGKRGIPLDLLDNWLQLLEIEVKITPKGHKPVKEEKETQNDLKKFESLKKRRNYLIAEMRAMMAERVMQLPEFNRTQEETGEGLFWPYSYCGKAAVGLIETRYDHPAQKFMAVEYTGEGVNVYKFSGDRENKEGKTEPRWLEVKRLYFSEDDFMMYSGIWDRESMGICGVSILRRNKAVPDGVEVVNVEGFPVRSLLEMQENYVRFLTVFDEVRGREAYLSMERELEDVEDVLLEISRNNRLWNGSENPEFVFWTDDDKYAIEVPLWAPERNWEWIEEGLTWRSITM